MPDYEELLRGSGHPRPLPPELRARLEDALFHPEPLPDKTPRRSENRLKAGREKPRHEKPKGKRLAYWLTTGAAAALVLVAALTVPALVHSTSRQLPVASRSGTSTSLRPTGAPGRAVAAPSAAGVPRPNPAHAGASRAALTPAPGAAKSNRGVAPPVVKGVNPNSGPGQGGNWVEVTGASFADVASVRFGVVPARRVVVLSVRELKALAPEHPAGTVDVVVQSRGGTSARSPADHYTFR